VEAYGHHYFRAKDADSRGEEGASKRKPLVFEGVTVASGLTADRTVTLAGGHVQFRGYYDAFPITFPSRAIPG
jgi:hypothetical protein